MYFLLHPPSNSFENIYLDVVFISACHANPGFGKLFYNIPLFPYLNVKGVSKVASHFIFWPFKYVDCLRIILFYRRFTFIALSPGFQSNVFNHYYMDLCHLDHFYALFLIDPLLIRTVFMVY